MVCVSNEHKRGRGRLEPLEVDEGDEANTGVHHHHRIRMLVDTADAKQPLAAAEDLIQSLT